MSDTEDHEQESAGNGEIVNSAGDNGSQDSENNHSDKVNGAKDDAEEEEVNGEENGNEKDEENDDEPEEKSDICEVIDEAEDSNQSKLDSTGDVITVDDKGEDIPSKTVPDTVFFDSVSEEEKKYYEEKSPSQQSLETMSIQCTACWKQVNHHVMNNIMRHPVLGVPICRNCRYFYDGDGSDESWEKDEDGVDLYCRWCGQGGEVVGCDDCHYVFCKKCITRNLGRGKFGEINDAEKWSCFCCDPSQIYRERALMFSLAKWMVDLKLKKRMKAKLNTEKKKTQVMKQKVEAKKKLKEAAFEKEASKVDNFVDEAFHEAFETLNIYQKCLQDEQKKWIKQRKNMTPDNTAKVVKNLRKIFSITRQNMELLDTTLVQGYSMVYPEESDRKIRVQGAVGLDDSASSHQVTSTPIKTPAKRGRKRKKEETNGNGEDIEVEEIVVNGENVLEKMDNDSDAFDPSLLCSVEITAVDREESSSPELKRNKPSIFQQQQQRRGPMKLSNSMFKKKKMKMRSPIKTKKRRRKPSGEIEEITLTDDEEEDENSTSYVTQSEVGEDAVLGKASEFVKSQQKKKALPDDGDDSDAIDSDVSLE